MSTNAMVAMGVALLRETRLGYESLDAVELFG